MRFLVCLWWFYFEGALSETDAFANDLFSLFVCVSFLAHPFRKGVESPESSYPCGAAEHDVNKDYDTFLHSLVTKVNTCPIVAGLLST